MTQTDVRWPGGDSDMAGRIRALDWAATPLGPLPGWPQSLRTAVDVVLAMPGPATILWGPAHVQIYNDAYAVIARDRHPVLLGRPVAEGWPDAYEAVIAPLLRAAGDGRAVRLDNFRVALRAPDGGWEERVFDTAWSPLRDEAGRVAGALQTLTEVTERHRAHAASRESEERGAFLLRLSDALRPLVDPTTIQGTACRLLGEHLRAGRAYYVEIVRARDVAVIEQDYVGGDLPSLVGALPLSSFRWVMPLYERGQPVVVFDVATSDLVPEADRRAMLAVGVVSWIAVPLVKGSELVGALCMAEGRPRAWTEAEVALVREASERLWASIERGRAEAALRESQARFSQFATSSSDALWIRDAATLRMEYVSPAIQAIYGVLPDAILGDVERWADLIVPDDRATAREHVEQARRGEVVVHEFRIRRPSDGEERWVRDTDFPLLDPHGQVQRIGGIAEDVTEAKRAATRLETLINELQHRARNLLGVVIAVAGRTLRQGGSVEAFEERLQALSRAQGLLSRFGSDTVEVGALVRAELAAHVDGVSDGTADAVHLAGPEVHLTARQVQNFALALHELTTNAVKYGALKDDPGRLAVTWEVLPGRGDRRRIVLDWVESGVAVDPAEPARRGYGTELIQEVLAYALQAEVAYALGEDGVRCRIEMPIS